MVKVEIEISQAEYDIVAKIAEKMGLDAQKLMQQETIRTIETISVWTQRTDMLIE